MLSKLYESALAFDTVEAPLGHVGTTWPSGVGGWLLDQAIPEGVGSNPVGG